MNKYRKELVEALLVKQYESKQSWNQLAKKANISPSIVSKFLQTNSDISVESLNKILKIFNTDVYEAIKKELNNRIHDWIIDIPVTGIIFEQKETYKNVEYQEKVMSPPTVSYPSFIKRSNLWEGYHCAIANYNPVYNWQFLYHPEKNRIGTEWNKPVLSLITFKRSSKKIKVLCGEIQYRSRSKFYTYQAYPGGEESIIPADRVTDWNWIEVAFSDLRDIQTRYEI